MIVSIFNDVVGPVMRGPSSSHCAAALRIGRLARDLMGGEIGEVLVEFDRSGSLPTTHESQGSDMGLFGGLLGWDAADERLPGSGAALAEVGIVLRFETVDVGDPHPNTYRLSLSNGRESHQVVAISTGGGMIEVQEVDGFRVKIGGDYEVVLVRVARGMADEVRLILEAGGMGEVVVNEGVMGVGDEVLVEGRGQVAVGPEVLAALGGLEGVGYVRALGPQLPVLSRRGVTVPYGSGEELLAYGAGREVPLWKLAVDYEMARGGLSEGEVVGKMVEIVRILRRSIAEGIAGTEYEDRVLGHQSGRFAELMGAGRLLDGGALNRIVLYVAALMEVKSSMGVIVAAPTAGACAAMPAAIIGMGEALGLGEEEMARAMLAAGAVGVLIATRWTFAAEVGGCQAEGGSAAAMAAAALVDMAGGGHEAALGAASMALGSMLGLICDPVANRVEVPCLGKNVLAASNALSCANMALAGFDAVIPFDEVLESAQRVAGQMPRELRCTSLGGLAITKTSLEIERRLAGLKVGGCGGGCGC
jgi:L-serine dehydratase